MTGNICQRCKEEIAEGTRHIKAQFWSQCTVQTSWKGKRVEKDV